MIEAKYRNDFRDYVKLKDSMATWARYEDLIDGNKLHAKTPRFDEVWIVSNGNISKRSRAWGICKGMRVIGWHYPAKKGSLAEMVDRSALYPITAIDNISRKELDAFAEKSLILCREIADVDPSELAHDLDLNPKRAANIVSTCQAVIGHNNN